MDARRCYFPNYYRMGDHFQPSSHWPLSNVRSSVRRHDDSSDHDSGFEVGWVGDHPFPIPYQQRTIRNLTGRSLEESLARFKRKRSPSCEGSAGPPREPEGRKTPDSQYAPKNERPSPEVPPSTSFSQLGYQEMTDATTKGKAQEGSHPIPVGSYRLISTDKMIADASINETPTQQDPYIWKVCDTAFARNSELQRHSLKHEVEKQDKAPRIFMDVKASSATNSMSIDDVPVSPRSSLLRREKTPQSLGVISPHQQPNEAPGPAHNSERILVPQPQAQILLQAPHRTADHLPSLPQSTAAPPLIPEQSEDDNNAVNDNEALNPDRPTTKVKKPKQKSNQQGAHLCKLCDITFTRHFDLLRHNQKHQVETEEDIARRTCTNCDRVLSRVDATKRHVDTLPESCNYLRKKQGSKPLPVMPGEHYVTCKERYYKLAQEGKKPKGRKKANPAA